MSVPLPKEIQLWYADCGIVRVWNRMNPSDPKPFPNLADYVRPGETSHLTVPGRMSFSVLETKG